jgi:hypothetical protein
VIVQSSGRPGSSQSPEDVLSMKREETSTSPIMYTEVCLRGSSSGVELPPSSSSKQGGKSPPAPRLSGEGLGAGD